MDFDDSFLLRLRDGHAAAYETLVEQFEGPLYRFFLCDHRDHHAAQEQAAETFTQLVRSLPTMRGGPQQLRAFVFGVARHVQRRRWRRRKTDSLPIDFAADVMDPGPSPNEQASTREQLDQVLQTLNSFEQPLQSVLFLRFVEECELDEIAEILEIPVGTVKSHIHRGRSRLKQIFKVEDCKK